MEKLIKSAFILFAVLFMGGSVFADSGANLVMEGNAWGTDGFKLNNQEQKDNDLLEFWYNGERAGGKVRLWSKLDDAEVKIRHAIIWFKPLSAVKISVGHVETSGYKEQINWWHVPTAEKDRKWSGYSTAEGGGVQIDLTAIENLSISATLAPGYDVTFWDDDESEIEDGKMKYGVMAKYNLVNFGSALLGYRDEGKGSAKLLRAGFDVKKSGFYGFLTGIVRLENQNTADEPEFELVGVSIDTYGAYSKDSFNAKIHLPITIRTTDIEGDDPYMSYDLRLSYSLDTITPYFRIQQEDGVIFNDDLKVAPQLNVGMTWGYDGGSFDLGLQINTPKNDDETTWSIPFKFKLAF